MPLFSVVMPLMVFTSGETCSTRPNSDGVTFGRDIVTINMGLPKEFHTYTYAMYVKSIHLYSDVESRSESVTASLPNALISAPLTRSTGK